jgi:hypothetical protein
MKREFTVIEYASGYAVRHEPSGKQAWMSDGVDVLTTPTGRSMRPGSEYFRKTWQEHLNQIAGDTREAYFPELEAE